jgi:hypothetical protein
MMSNQTNTPKPPLSNRLELELFGPRRRPIDQPKATRKPKPKPRVKAKPRRIKAKVVHYEWRVRYRRRWWASSQSRIFQSVPPIRRLIEHLRRPYKDCEPIVEMQVQRRVVGEWEDIPMAVIVDYQPESHHRKETQ